MRALISAVVLLHLLQAASQIEVLAILEGDDNTNDKGDCCCCWHFAQGWAIHRKNIKSFNFSYHLSVLVV